MSVGYSTTARLLVIWIGLVP